MAGKPSRPKRRGSRARTAAKCRFCRENATDIDYKDLNVLHKMVSSQGKQFARKRTGNCAKHQRMSRRAIKRARHIGLLAFTG